MSELTEAIELRDAANAAQYNLGVYVGTDRVVVRPDLKFVIIYASTATHALESRSTGRGMYTHRINRDMYAHAEEIPTGFRKLKAIAERIERADHLALAALDARYKADLALTVANKYRNDATREQAREALAAPSPFAA